MRITPTYHLPENVYRLSYGQTGNELFAGNFAHKESKGDYALLELDEFDKTLVAHIALKPGEIVYRSYTDCSKICGISFLVKINLNNGMVYFMDQEKVDEIIFERKGVQLCYLNLIWHPGAAVYKVEADVSILPLCKSH